MVPHKGSVEGPILQLTAASPRHGPDRLRVDRAVRTKSKMIRTTAAGLKESHPHDVIIKEAPNYRREET
jgi:IMP dehydrogenase